MVEHRQVMPDMRGKRRAGKTSSALKANAQLVSSAFVLLVATSLIGLLFGGSAAMVVILGSGSMGIALAAILWRLLVRLGVTGTAATF